MSLLVKNVCIFLSALLSIELPSFFKSSGAACLTSSFQLLTTFVESLVLKKRRLISLQSFVFGKIFGMENNILSAWGFQPTTEWVLRGLF
jgi:hypothetical protein